MGILTNLGERDVLFIDEIHRLPRVVEELLYPAMEDFSINFVMDKGLNARTMRIPLRPFTLVGATTRPGMLSSPLRERFGIFHHLDFYSVEELCSIILRSASILGATVEPGGRGGHRAALARDPAHRQPAAAPRARLLPGQGRRGGHRRRRRATRSTARASTTPASIASIGASSSPSSSSTGAGPVGLEAIAATINDEAETLAEVVEPFLLKIGYVVRSPNGRKATPAPTRTWATPRRPPSRRQGQLPL